MPEVLTSVPGTQTKNPLADLWHVCLAPSRMVVAPGRPFLCGARAERGPSPAGVHVQSFQVAESSGLYTLRSVLKARLGKDDRDARFYCELSYRMPNGHRMKESQEVTVPVFCEYQPCTGGLGGRKLAAMPAPRLQWGGTFQSESRPARPEQTQRRRCGWKWSPRGS